MISSTGAFGLTKIGSGKAILSSTNLYTGDTSILGGTLSITNPYLVNAADVYLTTGALFNLSFAGTDTIDSLLIDSVMQAAGTWGGAGSGAAHISSLLSGTGLLLVSTGAVGVPGDYSNNGIVDAADYVLWRNGGPLQNEVDTPGTVNAADYTAWRARFGNTSGSGSGLGSDAGSVPEPVVVSLLLSVIVGAAVPRRRR